MATLHKFITGGTSLTIGQRTGYSINCPSYSYYVPDSYSGYNISNADITNVKNQQIEIVTQSTTTKFLSHPNFFSNTTHCQGITPPTPTQESDGYHYIFPANTFTYNKVAVLGNLIKTAGSNHYYSTLPIIKAYAGGPHWEDVDIPEFGLVSLTPKTVEGYGDTTYQSTYIIYYPPTSTTKPFMSGYSNSQGKIRYFELPPGDGKFETNVVSYAFVTDAIAYNQKVQELTATSISGSKRTWDAGPSDTTRYILITASVPSTAGNIATNTTMGTASASNVWGTGTLHARTNGSWK